MKVYVRQNKKVVVGTNNSIGRVTFGKVARVGSVTLGQLSDVDTTGEQEGDVLVYQANTDTYAIRTLPKVDGGTY